MPYARTRDRFTLECLEPRLTFSGTPTADPPPALDMTATLASGDETPALLTASPATDQTDAPWLRYAQERQAGTLVTRMVVTPPATGVGEPDTRIELVVARFNASLHPAAIQPTVPVPAPAASITAPPTEPRVEGVVFPGQGVVTDPSDTWPKSIDRFEPSRPATLTGSQEFYAVFESDSDVMLGTLCFCLSLAADPEWRGGGTVGTDGGFPVSSDSTTGSDGGGTSADGGGLSGMNGLSAFAALAGFAMLAGLGDMGGPSVSLTNDTGASGDDRITRDGRLVVDAPAGSKVQYSIDAGRTWRASFRRREGLNDVQIRTVTDGGVASSVTSLSFTLDRRPPPVPRITLERHTGVSPAGPITSPGDIAVHNRESGASLEYSVNGGGWTSAYLPVNGRNRVLVRQIDTAGNVSKPSKPVVFRLDTPPLDATPAMARGATSGTTTDSIATSAGPESGSLVAYASGGGTDCSPGRSTPSSRDRRAAR